MKRHIEGFRPGCAAAAVLLLLAGCDRETPVQQPATTAQSFATTRQLMLGLVNGAFYAMLSLGLAVIFGLLDVVNFAHGALYMLGAFTSWILLDKLGKTVAAGRQKLSIGSGGSSLPVVGDDEDDPTKGFFDQDR